MEGASQVCRNCKRSMASTHVALHEAHCLLFLALCPECKEPVPQGKMDEHRENGHQETTECRERPAECKFCRAVVRLSKLETHEHHCGSRTELCLDCGQQVVVRMLAQHRKACPTEQAQRRAETSPAPEHVSPSGSCAALSEPLWPSGKWFG
uniref:XIAP associated factor 1 n=1 Tax=Molossus molossus TaxID=27622 RepID=A0A7J8D3Z9_MOLMO|nr:XIAP associated factor 1 [Molossus molossus]